MKYLIVSDIHGSLPALESVLDVYDREHCDMLLLLGDILNYGPRNRIPEGIDPKGIAQRLNAMKESIVAVRGNCDSEVDQMVLRFPMLADSALLYADGKTIFATHGHLHGPDAPPPLKQGDFLLCGHTHLPVRRDHATFTYLNPGSLSLPKEGTPHSYMTLEDGVFTWHDLVTGEAFEPLN